MPFRFVVLCGVLVLAPACDALAAEKPARTPKTKQPPPKAPAKKKPVAKIPSVKKAVAKTPIPAAPASVPPVDLEAAKFSRVNSLGMKFVRVGEIEMCIWPVRVGDFEKFAVTHDAAARGRWRNPGFPQTSDHPVVNVSWKDAMKFCAWLTQTERALGKLDAASEYRLPMDTDWSRAVGLAEEKGDTPEGRDLLDSESYPWGTQWPPPRGAGNFLGAEATTELPIEGYRDDFANTSPVGSFTPNALGLYDMAGNIWHWCRDPIRPGAIERTLRGSSWYNGTIRFSLLSSCRIKSNPDAVNDTYGFRVVIAPANAGDNSAAGN